MLLYIQSQHIWSCGTAASCCFMLVKMLFGVNGFNQWKESEFLNVGDSGMRNLLRAWLPVMEYLRRKEFLLKRISG